MEDFSGLFSGAASEEELQRICEMAEQMAGGQQHEQPSGGFGGTPDIGALMGLLRGFSEPQSDKNIALIEALAPHLGEHRQKKAQEAIKVLRLLRLLPLLRESGLLGDLL